MAENKSQLDARKSVLKELDERMEAIEEHFIEKRFYYKTFDRWSKRYNIDRQQQEKHIADLVKNIDIQLQAMEQLLKTLSCIHDIYTLLDPLQKLTLSRLIFRHGFFIEDGLLSTHHICSALSHNITKLHKAGLLKNCMLDSIDNIEKDKNLVALLSRQLVNPKEIIVSMIKINHSTYKPISYYP